MSLAKTDVVIDKSFLQGAPKDILESLFKNQRVLMTSVNFLELLTTSATERARCFKKLPKSENPVALVEPLDLILRWEVENQQPLSNIDHVIRREQFHFNSGLDNENFQMEEEQTNYTEYLKRRVATQAKEFAEHCSIIPFRFPEIKNCRPGDSLIKIKEIQKRVSTDPEFVRELYSGRLEDTWPPPTDIDERWALFRWIQIGVLAALDYFRKYGEREMRLETTKIENEYLDLEYCLIGCLVGSIATRDKRMAKRFLAICPSGGVIS